MIGTSVSVSVGVWALAMASTSTAALSLSFVSGPIDSRITFTRASTATYFDSAGVMQTASANVARLDHNPAALTVPGPELVVNGTFATDTVWTKGAGTTISGGAANIAASGTTALVQSGIQTPGRLHQITLTITANLGSDCQLHISQYTPTISLSALGVGTHTVTVTPTSADFTISNFSGSITIDNVSVRLLDAAPLGLLIEEARTNLLVRSQEFDNVAWAAIAGASIVTANARTAPDGTTTADKIIANTTAVGAHGFFQTATVANLSTNTFSVFVEAGEYNWAAVAINDAADHGTWVNLTTGALGTTFGTLVSKSIQDCGGGRYRVTITRTAPGTAAVPYVAFSNADKGAADGRGAFAAVVNSGIYVWGAQLEAGAFATSYIPTVAATVTRAADAASMTGTNFSSWYNQSDGTFVAQFTPLVVSVNSGIFAVNDGTWTETMITTPGATSNAVVIDGGVTVASLATAGFTVGVTSKLAFSYKLNDFAASTNGGVVATDVVGTIPTVDRLTMAATAINGQNTVNGHIKSLTYFKTRKTNLELQALST